MCKIINRFVKPYKFKGYKVALHIDGKYYSPATLVEYVVGDVPECPIYNKKLHIEILKLNTGFDPSQILYTIGNHHNSQFKGNTAVFVNIDDATIIKESMNDITDKKVVVLEMTIIASMDCTVDEMATKAGNKILSIKEI